VNVFRDLSGQKFGRLTVIQYAGHRRTKGGESVVRWLCRCDCGNEIEVDGGALTKGHSKSCGCSRSEKMRGNKNRTTHGMKGTRVYIIWVSMRQRCSCKNRSNFQDYGGRGIKVCDRWNTFENFLEDMGEPPGKDYSLDRIDVNGNYCRENCRWATNKDQANNRRNNRIIGWNGIKKTISEWSESVGIASSAIIYRLNHGWPVEEALTVPSRLSK
jgi:hypothetical protein